MSKDSTKPTPSINRPKSSLATASGLDDLLSLTDNNPPPNGRSRGVGVLHQEEVEEINLNVVDM